MDQQNLRHTQSHGRKLLEYFQILNSGDRGSWEQAFDETWHPEAIVDRWTTKQLRQWHRRRLGSDAVGRVHVIRNLDAHRVEFTSEVNGKYGGPFVATFRDGRIYRVL